MASPHDHRPCEILHHIDGRVSCTACGGRAATERYLDCPMDDDPLPLAQAVAAVVAELAGRVCRQCSIWFRKSP